MAGRIAVVDEENRFVRWETRRRIHEQRLVHRSIHVLVFDAKQRLLLQQRHREKQTYPLFWDGSCAGHVEESDYLAGPNEHLERVYADVAARELSEELGVTPDLEFLTRFSPIPEVHYEQIAFYRAFCDGPFTLQVEEVEAIKHVTRPELDAMINDPDVAITPMVKTLTRWLCERDLWR